MSKRLLANCKNWLVTAGALTALPLVMQAQVPTINWDVTAGGKERDVLNSMALTADNGYIFGGTSTSGAAGERKDDSRGKEDYWIVKLNNAGNIEWTRAYGGEDVDELKSIRAVKGGYIVGGTSASNKAKKGEKEEDSKGGKDYWILKLNEKGDIEWQRTIGGVLDDDLAVILPTNDGGFIAGGTSASPKSGDKSEDGKGIDPRTNEASDYWIVKLTGKGDIEWDRTIGGTAYARLTDMLVVDDGFIAGGYALPGRGNDRKSDGFGSYDYWIVKLTEKGDLQWEKTYGGDRNDQLVSMSLYGEKGKEGFVIAGNSDSEPSGNKKDRPVKGSDYWIVKLNPEGDYEWDKVIGSGGTDYLKSVQVVERNIILGGESDGERSGHKSEDPRAKNSSDIWVVKLNEKGDVEWDKTMGGDKSDMGGIIYATPDAGYIVGAYSSSGRANEKTDGSRGDFDYWMIKLVGCTPVKTTENKTFCQGTKYTLPDGRIVSTAGTYTSIVKGKTGCEDTTVTVLTESMVYRAEIYDTICQGSTYTLPDGRQVVNDGYYRVSFPTVNNCDSVIFVSLTYKTIDTSFVSSAICPGGSFTLPGGQVVTDEGVYYDAFVTAEGCDSVIVTTLSKDGVDSTITVFNDELSANQVGANYEWIDCATNQPIPGANAQNFAPEASGRYAVRITLNGCDVTSDCYDFEKPTQAVNEISGTKGVKLFPNPAKNSFTVDAGAMGNIEHLVIFNSVGAAVMQMHPEHNVVNVPVAELAAGMYMIQIQTASGVSTLKVQLLP